MVSICLFTEVKRQTDLVSTGMGDLFSALLQSLMALQLILVDHNPLLSCFNEKYYSLTNFLNFFASYGQWGNCGCFQVLTRKDKVLLKNFFDKQKKK